METGHTDMGPSLWLAEHPMGGTRNAVREARESSLPSLALVSHGAGGLV